MVLPAIRLALSAAVIAAPAPVRIEVNPAQGRTAISPYLYGKNGNLAGSGEILWGARPELALEAGLRLSRESDGNNGTKYNWRNDLSSHPDWYNNVYRQDRPRRARAIQDRFPAVDGLFALPVLGWVAKTDAFNTHEDVTDPGHKNPHANLAGHGVATLYLEAVTPAETVGVLDHWFTASPTGLGLDPNRFRLWHLDNEPECWAGTHDDISSTTLTGEECVRRYVAIAKEVRTRHPEFRLMAPGFSSEWFWWNWTNQSCVGGLPWMEYFIKRMAEESRTFGRPLLDLIDIHTYINDHGTDADILMEHRNWYDPGYASPAANGCKRLPDCGWHDDQRVEMALGRIEGWLDTYFGKGHGIGIATTESGPHSKEPMVQALWYASQLGTFSDHGVKVFTPWFWEDPMWEVLHLFTKTAGTIRVSTSCTGEPLVSCYASVTESGDRLTAILVNRDTEPRQADLSLGGFKAAATADGWTLEKLPAGVRTFESRTKNALIHDRIPVRGARVRRTLPPRSITAIVVPGRMPTRR